MARLNLYLQPFVRELLAVMSTVNLPSMAAALAYYGIFSLAPILYIALRIAGVFVDGLLTTTQLYTQLARFVGADGAKFIYELMTTYLDQTPQTNLVASLISIVTLIYAATSLFAQLHYSLNQIWSLSTPAKQGQLLLILRQRLLAFVMVISLGFLIALSTVAALVISFLNNIFEFGGYLSLINGVAFIIVSIVLSMLVYKYVPDVSLAWGDVWLGAVLTAIALSVGRSLVGVFLAFYTGSTAFEVAGTVAVLLIAIYFAAQLFLFGSAITRAYAFTFGSKVANSNG